MLATTTNFVVQVKKSLGGFVPAKIPGSDFAFFAHLCLQRFVLKESFDSLGHGFLVGNVEIGGSIFCHLSVRWDVGDENGSPNMHGFQERDIETLIEGKMNEGFGIFEDFFLFFFGNESGVMDFSLRIFVCFDLGILIKISVMKLVAYQNEVNFVMGGDVFVKNIYELGNVFALVETSQINKVLFIWGLVACSL